MKATEQLQHQHEQLLAIFDELEFTADRQERMRLAGHLAERLKAHTAVEEEVFYPAIETLGSDHTRQAVKEALEAHRAADVLLDEILGSELTAPAVKVLRNAVEDHIADEESRLFPLAEALGEATTGRLALSIERYARESDDDDEDEELSATP
jgi:iron-sulfur cluster repair protein YtfE (RIC family)